MNQKSCKTGGHSEAMFVGVLCRHGLCDYGGHAIPIIPAAGFLKLDVKDGIITIGALIYGPITGC